jgi:exopolysaccharide biosynthesis polyprenyl glycosylphosphotransferase
LAKGARKAAFRDDQNADRGADCEPMSASAPASGRPPGPAALVRTLRTFADARRVQAFAIPELRGPAASLHRDTLFRRGLLAADIAALAIALGLTHMLDHSLPTPWWLALITAATLVLSAKLAALYDRDQALLRKSTLEEIPALAQLATLCVLVAWLASDTGPGPPARAPEVLTLWVSLTLALILARALARALVLALVPTERCLIVGDDGAAERIRAKLESGSGINACLVAHVDLDRVEPFSSAGSSEPRLEEIGRLAQSLDVQRAIIAPRSADAGETLDLVRTLKAVGVRVSMVPRLLEVVGSSIAFDDLNGLTLMGISRFELTRSSLAIKRAFDLGFAWIALVLLSPILCAIAIAVVLDSRGGVLFRQSRAGRRGRPFKIYKFRTMVADAEARKEELRGRNETEGLFKIRADPRITRVGGFLRRTALDELPQLINVLRGEMSLVGPRPLVLDEDRQVEGWYRRRLELTPGVTGPWQILGPARVPLREMAAIDYLYVANWSLWADVKVLLRTVSYVLARRGL